MRWIASCLTALAMTVLLVAAPALGQVNVTAGPSSQASNGIVAATSTATESNRVISAAPKNLYSLVVTNLSTTTLLYLMVFDATAVPADGAVTPRYCLPVAANSSLSLAATGGPPMRFATGVSVALSSTGCTTKTASVNGFFSWSVQ